MKQKYARAYTKAVANDAGLLTAVIGSTATVDRYGESIDQNSWDLKHFKKNPVILWAHNLTFGEDRPPIGKAMKVKVVDNALTFDIQFDMADPFAADIFRKYKEGFLNAFSVGFIPHTIQRYTDTGEQLDAPVLRDNELLELSAVPVPANPEALNALRSRSFKTKTWDKLMKEVDAEDEEDDEEEEETPTPPAPTPAPAAPAEDPKPAETPAPEEEAEKILKGLQTLPADKIAEAIKKLPADQLKTITNLVMGDSGLPEKKGGSDSDPKTPQQSGGKKLVKTIRLATRMLQGALAEANAEAKKS